MPKTKIAPDKSKKKKKSSAKKRSSAARNSKADTQTLSQADDTQAHSGSGKQLGALDLGSNSFHLLVAREHQGHIQFLDKHKEMVRLAEGLDADKQQMDDSVAARALACLGRFGERLRPLEPENVRIVGTNTLRQIGQSAKFIKQAEEALGHKIEIISGYEEARLIYLGVSHDIGLDVDKRLVIDIGGGSTEIILGRMATPVHLESLHMGCVSMTTRFFRDGKITAKRFDAAINDALLELEPVVQEFLDHGWDTTIGASGTINAVLSVMTDLDVDAETIAPENLQILREALIKAGDVRNIALESLADERKPVFPGGVAILIALFTALDIEQMRAAQSALREGLIYDLLGRQHHDDARDHTVEGLLERFYIDAAQAQRVRETAIGLLSQVAKSWDVTTADDRHLLGWAASLHELGRGISHTGFHKHGAYLIEHLDMPGFARSEQNLLAALVRNHRRKLVLDEWTKAPRSLRLMVVLRLAAVLHRNRGPHTLPHIELAAASNRLTITLPQTWAERHQLTLLDIENEARYLSSAGINLEIAFSD